MKRLIAVVLALSLLSCGAAWADAEGKPLEGRNLVVAMSPDFMYFETVSQTEE